MGPSMVTAFKVESTVKEMQYLFWVSRTCWIWMSEQMIFLSFSNVFLLVLHVDLYPKKNRKPNWMWISFLIGSSIQGWLICTGQTWNFILLWLEYRSGFSTTLDIGCLIQGAMQSILLLTILRLLCEAMTFKCSNWHGLGSWHCIGTSWCFIQASSVESPCFYPRYRGKPSELVFICRRLKFI